MAACKDFIAKKLSEIFMLQLLVSQFWTKHFLKLETVEKFSFYQQDCMPAYKDFTGKKLSKN